MTGQNLKKLIILKGTLESPKKENSFSALETALERAKENRQAENDRLATARRAAEEARQRKLAAEALLAETDQLRKLVDELRLVENFLDEAGWDSYDEATLRLANLEAREDIKSLMAEREAWAVRKAALEKAESEERARLAKAEAKAKADQSRTEAKAKAVAESEALLAQKAREVEVKKISKKIFEWANKTKTSTNQLCIINSWSGKAAPKSAVRLEKIQSEKKPQVRVSAVHGETDVKVGQTWVAECHNLPAVFRKALVNAGWVAP